jgi:hypothetical protein
MGLEDRYRVRVFTLNNWDELFAWLDALSEFAVSVPALQPELSLDCEMTAEAPLPEPFSGNGHINR